MARTPKKQPQWYRLDNAGVLYSALKKEKYAPVYRFSAVMTDPVNPLVLQSAVDRTMPRFPGFQVRIRKGAFWCYFEPNPKPGPFVRPDIANPCQPMREKDDNDWRRLQIESNHFHVPADIFRDHGMRDSGHRWALADDRLPHTSFPAQAFSCLSRYPGGSP